VKTVLPTPLFTTFTEPVVMLPSPFYASQHLTASTGEILPFLCKVLHVLRSHVPPHIALKIRHWIQAQFSLMAPSQNHRRGIWRLPSPTPLLEAGSSTAGGSGLCLVLALNISKSGDSTTSLGNLSQCSTTLYFSGTPRYFSVCSVALAVQMLLWVFLGLGTLMA